MPQQGDDMVAVRREMLDLLREQMEVLDSGLELTDGQLRECFDRHGRVQELREKLQAAVDEESKNGSSGELNSVGASTVNPSARGSSVHTIEPRRESLANL